ncbi:MAG: PepSY domain-containing protein [Candidatus Gastranaerophilales bacterium]|nr:PepSY domain-containing protein [Candidatus Gastranaerophilales bacterium]
MIMTLSFGGCGLIRTRGLDPSAMQSLENQVPSAAGSGAGQSQASGAVDLEAAKDIALLDAGLDADSVTFVKAEQDYDDGRVEYEIEFVTDTTRYEYEVRASDGMIRGRSQEPIQNIPSVLQSQGTISVEDAKAAALSYVQVGADQAVYTDIEMDYDDGVTQYEIEFCAGGKEYSVTVNAANGEILEVEID